MNEDEGIDGLLVLDSADTQGFAVGSDPPRLIRLGIRAHLQCLAGAHSRKGFEHHLPAQGLGPDRAKQEFRNKVESRGVMRHEFPAMPHALGSAIPRPPETQRIQLNEVSPQRPQNGVAQRGQLQVHRPVPRSPFDLRFAPFVKAVAFLERELAHRHIAPVFEQHHTITLLAFQRPTLPGLFLAVGIAVLLVSVDDIADKAGWGILLFVRLFTKARSPLV